MVVETVLEEQYLLTIMHELSVAQNILDIVSENVPVDKRERIRSVRVAVGESAGIVTDSLVFCFQAVVHGTEMEQVLLDIDRIPFRIMCDHCGVIQEDPFATAICPACGSRETRVLSGTELLVSSIALDET